MIRASADVPVVLAPHHATSKQNSVQPAPTAILSLEDRITISANAFRVEMNVEDYLPQSRDLNKKNFKSVKEYAEYLLMLLMKLRDLKPKPGEIHVKMEDQAELQKALKDLGDMKLS